LLLIDTRTHTQASRDAHTRIQATRFVVHNCFYVVVISNKSDLFLGEVGRCRHV